MVASVDLSRLGGGVGADPGGQARAADLLGRQRGIAARGRT
jgi:hypothetical protein